MGGAGASLSPACRAPAHPPAGAQRRRPSSGRRPSRTCRSPRCGTPRTCLQASRAGRRDAWMGGHGRWGRWQTRGQLREPQQVNPEGSTPPPHTPVARSTPRPVLVRSVSELQRVQLAGESSQDEQNWSSHGVQLLVAASKWKKPSQAVQVSATSQLVHPSLGAAWGGGRRRGVRMRRLGEAAAGARQAGRSAPATVDTLCPVPALPVGQARGAVGGGGAPVAAFGALDAAAPVGIWRKPADTFCTRLCVARALLALVLVGARHARAVF